MLILTRKSGQMLTIYRQKYLPGRCAAVLERISRCRVEK